MSTPKDKVKKFIREIAALRSPRVVAWFKLGAAIVAVVMAADEVINGAEKSKSRRNP